MPAPDEQVIDGIGLRELVPTPWVADAACADADPALIFGDPGADPSKAQAICAGCPVRTECLDFAIATSERFGIWGGMGQKARRIEARRRRQAA